MLESLPVLRQRDFRLFLCSQAVSLFGDRIVLVALAFAVLEVSDSPSAVGLVMACGTVPLLASVLVGGVVADRSSRRAIMVGADLVRVASQAATAALVIAGAADVATLAVLAGITGVATGFFNPAATGLLPEVVRADQLQQANGLRATALSGGEILGPLTAGVLVVVVGPGWALAGDALTYAISAACLLRLGVTARVDRESSPFLTDLKDGWHAFRSRTWVWTVATAVALVNMTWAAWNALGPVIADRRLGGASAWGGVLAAWGAGALAGSVLATRAHPARPLIVFSLAAALLGLPLALLAVGAPVLILAVAALVSGGALMVGNTLWETTLQRHIPQDAISRVSAYDWFGSLAFYPLGLAVWASVAAALGIAPALWIAFVLHIATALLVLALPDVRRLPAYPDQAANRRQIAETQLA